MLAQRGEGFRMQGEARAEPAKAKPVADTPEPARKAPKRRLSFNDNHALATLPKVIADLEHRIGELRMKLEDQGLYTRDPAAFDKAASDMTDAQEKLAEAESRWLELEILREEIEQA